MRERDGENEWKYVRDRASYNGFGGDGHKYQKKVSVIIKTEEILLL